MNARIVRIGNSRGIRIPKPLLEQAGLRDEVEISVKNGSLVIRPARQPRAGWAEAFEAMARHEHDALIDADAPSTTRWDEDEWEWQ